MFAKLRGLNLSIIVAVMVMTTGVASVQAAPSARSEKTSEMLQFTNSGHMLGFQSSGVYVAAGSHMLRESFAGTKGAAPQAGRPSAKDGRAQFSGTVSYPDLWERITLIYDSPPGGILRSTYQIEPGGNPDQIALRYNVPVYMSSSGNLVFKFDTGTMTASSPAAWQEIEGKRIPVDVAFQFDSSRSTVQFTLGYYNPALRLTIDPTLSWNTFMGGLGSSDVGKAIAVDGSGNVYVAGYSAATWGSPVNDHTGGFGNMDAFAAKLNNRGETVWNTFMGSTSDDRGYGIAVDGNGNVYVAGSSGFTWGSPVNAHAGGLKDDAFVAKLNSSGETVWNTFMGSSSDDFGYGIAVDGSGNVYVAGYSSATWGSPVNNHTGGSDNYDVFAVKLNSNGARQWNTFMGSSSWDFGYGIAVDVSSNVYVTGNSFATWGSPANAHAGGPNGDAFVSKLNCSGGRQWNTFMGSSSDDFGDGIAVDRSGNVYVVGHSAFSWGSPVNDHAGLGSDAFVAKLLKGALTPGIPLLLLDFSD